MFDHFIEKSETSNSLICPNHSRSVTTEVEAEDLPRLFGRIA